jgi:ectoine hydroxylase-related dioxygenase (phytanoyl-CoA dioxygenase family)
VASLDKGGSLTAEQVEFYNSQGYCVLENLLTDADLAPCREAMTQKVDAIAADLLAHGKITDVLAGRPFQYRLAELFAGLTDQDFLKYGRGWRDRLAGYYVLMSNPKILDAVQSLIGPEIFANPVYNVRPKVPKVAAGAVPWHQDKSYWPDANANPVITVWIPLVDSTPTNGCLHLIPGTHRERVIPHHKETYSSTGYLALGDEVTQQKKVLPLPMKAGSAVLFNDRLLHMSTPNNSDHVRWSVDLRYQPTDQDPMPAHGAGFLARSRQHPERVATLADWLECRPEHGGEIVSLPEWQRRDGELLGKS